MKMTKQQRAARDKAIQQASIAAIRDHFSGDGAQTRVVRFVRAWLYSSCGWFAKLLCLASWAVVAGLLIGPEHEQFMSEFHSWMVATPVADVLAQSQAFFSMIAVELVKTALLVGLAQKLFAVVKPAVDNAKSSFNQSLA
jgi:hypothetical protein